MKRFLFLVAAFLALAGIWEATPDFTSAAHAAPPEEGNWVRSNAGKVKSEKLMWHRGDSVSVRIRNFYADSTIIQATLKDTTKWYPLAGIKALAVDWYAKARQDSLALSVTMEVSPDTTVTGSRFTVPVTSPVFSLGYSTTVTTGSAGLRINASGDTTAHIVYYFDNARVDSAVANSSKGLREVGTSRFGRWIATGSMGSAGSLKDTANVHGVATFIFNPSD